MTFLACVCDKPDGAKKYKIKCYFFSSLLSKQNGPARKKEEAAGRMQFTCDNIVDCFLLGVDDGNDGSEANRVRRNKISAQCGADVVYIDVVLQAESLTGRL